MPAFLNPRVLRRILPTVAPTVSEGPRLPAAPLLEALDLDARTDWPTHRIRSFLSMQGGQDRPAR